MGCVTKYSSHQADETWIESSSKQLYCPPTSAPQWSREGPSWPDGATLVAEPGKITLCTSQEVWISQPKSHTNPLHSPILGLINAGFCAESYPILIYLCYVPQLWSSMRELSAGPRQATLVSLGQWIDKYQPLCAAGLRAVYKGVSRRCFSQRSGERYWIWWIVTTKLERINYETTQQTPNSRENIWIQALSNCWRRFARPPQLVDTF